MAPPSVPPVNELVMSVPFESSTCCMPSLPVVVCKEKLCPPITRGAPLPVVMVSPSLLCVTEIPVSPESCCTSSSRWSCTVPPTCPAAFNCESCPLSCAICLVSVLTWATVCVTCPSASVCALVNPLAVLLNALARFWPDESTPCRTAELVGFADSCERLVENPESAVAMSPPPAEEK